MTFKNICTGCGACCRMVSKVEGFPEEYVGEGGVCKNLDTDTNKCKIYETRPDICNVDKMYYLHTRNKKAKTMSKEKYFQMQKEACGLLQKHFGIEGGK